MLTSFDWAAGMCDYYFLTFNEVLIVEAILRTVSLKELDCIPDKLSVSSQSDDRQPAHNMFKPYTRELIY